MTSIQDRTNRHIYIKEDPNREGKKPQHCQGQMKMWQIIQMHLDDIYCKFGEDSGANPVQLPHFYSYLTSFTYEPLYTSLFSPTLPLKMG